MSTKPTLSLSTPKTASFPHRHGSVCSSSELRSASGSLPSALSEGRTPLSAASRHYMFREPLYSSGLPSAGLPSAGGSQSALARLEMGSKTPITPPVAYLDFLRGMSLASPAAATSLATAAQADQIAAAQPALTRTRTSDSISSVASNESCSSVDTSSSDNSDASDASLLDGQDGKGEDHMTDSAPSTGRSDTTCSCQGDKPAFVLQPVKPRKKSTSPKLAPIKAEPGFAPPTPGPASAPASTAFPSSRVPMSPAFPGMGLRSGGGLYSPMRTPMSARTVFDWEAALRARRLAEARRSHGVSKSNNNSNNNSSSSSTFTIGAKRSAAVATSPQPGRTDLAAAVAAAANAASRISPTFRFQPAIKSPSARTPPPTAATAGAMATATARAPAGAPAGAPTGAPVSPRNSPTLGSLPPKRELSRTPPGSGNVRQRVHEVVTVTRTVTYSGPPRVGPAPKGKRRKLDDETAVES